MYTEFETEHTQRTNGYTVANDINRYHCNSWYIELYAKPYGMDIILKNTSKVKLKLLDSSDIYWNTKL